jgi:hypothetical protein
MSWRRGVGLMIDAQACLPYMGWGMSMSSEAGGPEPLAESLAVWQQRLTSRYRAMLTAAAHLADYLQLQHRG